MTNPQTDGAQTIPIPHIDIHPDGTLTCHKCGHPYCTDGSAFTIGALHTLTKVHICPDGDPHGPALPV